MPTGYTAAVADGKVTEFRDFAMRCSRAMGALIQMREMPSSAEIPERFEVAPFYDIQLREAKDELAKFEKMTPADVEAAAVTEYEDAVRGRNNFIDECAVKADRYDDMLNEVRAWSPPTPDHEGFKKFMIDQLTESRKFDCISSENIKEFYSEPKKKTAEEWRAGRRKKLHDAVTSRAKAMREELDRVDGQNKWIADLRASLTGASVS